MSEPVPIVAIDTNILAWYVQDPATNTDPRVERAQWLIADLREAGAHIIVPSIALSEFLHPIPTEDRSAAWKAVSQLFHIAPHDARAAEIGADLASRSLAAQRRRPGDRHVQKADAQIVASAKAAGAQVFFSNDAECRALAAAAGMRALDLPAMPSTLFPRSGGTI
jgi:predicted nucleic acid-binding protein